MSDLPKYPDWAPNQLVEYHKQIINDFDPIAKHLLKEDVLFKLITDSRMQEVWSDFLNYVPSKNKNAESEFFKSFYRGIAKSINIAANSELQSISAESSSLKTASKHIDLLITELRKLDQFYWFEIYDELDIIDEVFYHTLESLKDYIDSSLNKPAQRERMVTRTIGSDMKKLVLVLDKFLRSFDGFEYTKSKSILYISQIIVTIQENQNDLHDSVKKIIRGNNNK